MANNTNSNNFYNVKVQNSLKKLFLSLRGVTLRIVRFSYQNEVKFGILENDSIYVISGDLFESFIQSDEHYNLQDVRILSPVTPSKIVCVGKNYKEHILELGGDIPDEPILFLKPPTSVLGPEESIVRPSISERVDFEGELAVVIKKKCRNICWEEAENYILGYTCANDVTARDLQRKDGQWTRSKSFDTFCPIGPWIETNINPDDLKIRTYLNGELKQSSSTSMMITPVFRLIEFAAKVMTLNPGDIVLTGTPEGIGPMQKGDVVEVVVESIGTLKNYVL